MKKSFKNNPVMAFLSAAEEDPEEIRKPQPAQDLNHQGDRSGPPPGQITVFEALGTPEDKTPAPRERSGGQSPDKPKEKRLTGHAGDADPGKIQPTRATRKKKADLTAEPPEGFRFIEKKSRRVQIVLRPSTYELARQAADAAGVSFNKWIEQAILDSLKK